MISPSTKKFVSCVKHEMKKHGVDFQLIRKKSVGVCNGYFHDNPPTLRVAIRRPEQIWLATLVHEYAHATQWLDDSKCWNAVYLDGVFDATEIINLWIARKIELTNTQLSKYIDRVQRLEIDCERRALKIINHYDLQIDKTWYIQQANAYLYFYTVIKQTRKWYTIGKEPYTNEQLCALMPTSFSDNYKRLPKGTLPIYNKLIK